MTVFPHTRTIRTLLHFSTLRGLMEAVKGNDLQKVKRDFSPVTGKAAGAALARRRALPGVQGGGADLFTPRPARAVSVMQSIREAS